MKAAENSGPCRTHQFQDRPQSTVGMVLSICFGPSFLGKSSINRGQGAQCLYRALPLSVVNVNTCSEWTHWNPGQATGVALNSVVRDAGGCAAVEGTPLPLPQCITHLHWVYQMSNYYDHISETFSEPPGAHWSYGQPTTAHYQLKMSSRPNLQCCLSMSPAGRAIAFGTCA